MTIPTSLDAEQRLCCYAVLRDTAHIVRLVDPAAFYEPKHQRIINACAELHDQGIDRTFETVASAADVEIPFLMGLGLPSSNVAGLAALADEVNRTYRLRELIRIGEQVVAAAGEHADPDELWEAAQTSAAHAFTEPVPETPLLTLDDFLEQDTGDTDRWLVPGFLRETWRAVVVGNEGGGKSYFIRQCAVAGGYGIHPFAESTRIEPFRSLIVDCENPQGIIQDGLMPLRTVCENITGEDSDGRVAVHSMTGGLDIRDRRERAQIEDLLARHEPDLLCIGPVYKMYRKRPGESDEETTKEIQDVLDQWRARFGVAMLIEHHAPHGHQGGRVMRPIGSSAWLRWPELGLGLQRDKQDPSMVKVGSWRGHRGQVELPSVLTRAEGRRRLPFAATFDEAPSWRALPGRGAA